MKRKKLDFEFGELAVRITDKLMDIETKDKQWKVQFKKTTKEYAQILFLIDREEMKLVETIAMFLFYSRLIVTDPLFVKKFMNALKDFWAEKSKLQEVSKEDDDKILEEEKALHENK